MISARGSAVWCIQPAPSRSRFLQDMIAEGYMKPGRAEHGERALGEDESPLGAEREPDDSTEDLEDDEFDDDTEEEQEDEESLEGVVRGTVTTALFDTRARRWRQGTPGPSTERPIRHKTRTRSIETSKCGGDET
jgi:hypothetical protein